MIGMDALNVRLNHSLRELNTFKLNVIAKEYIEYSADEDILVFLCNNDIYQKDFLVLGSGSNILFTKDFDGLVIHPTTDYINIISDNNEELIVEVASGLIWDYFVEWCVNNGFYGVENLTDIPGTVGASVVQNIGAYGTEVSKIVKSVKYIDIADSELYEIPNSQCKFAYRDSVFKKRLKNRTIILSVCFRLSKNGKLNTEYADVASVIKNYDNPGLEEMRLIIRNIRASKLPDYTKIGNAGSFFKNPVIDKLSFARIKNSYPDVKFYSNDDGTIKLAAAWMIDKCGFKGFEHNGAAVHENQALVIVNKNNASGKDILDLSDIIRDKVFRSFGVMLEPEVRIV